ncbi:MAG: hypothetical protein H6Q68_1716 [Firmicutes bacterium]|nr:hypothetical protein [Bacillota bacterium]
MTEKIIPFFFLLGSVVYLCLAGQLTFGTLQSPRSGFLPILAGITAVLFALFLIFKQLRSKESIPKENVDWTKFIFILIGLLFYITIFNIIGYFAATFIFLFYLFKIADTKGWIFPFMMAAGSSIVFYLLFKYFLAVTLP